MTRLCLLLLLIISLGAQVPTKINLAYQARGGSERIQRSLGASMALGGSALTAGMGVFTVAPFACIITGWDLAVDQGTATVKVWKVAAGTALPTSSNSINTNGVSIESGTVLESTVLSDFTTLSIAKGDVLVFSLAAVSVSTQLNFQLECAQSWP
jgi:hypothetical protein